MSLSSPTSKDDPVSLIFVPRSFSSSLGSLWLLCLLAAPFRSPISASQSKPPPHHCTFPPLSIQGAARGRVRSRPMRVQRGCQPTNQEPASWDAPAELAARHHLEKERPRVPPLQDGAEGLPGGHTRPPKALPAFSQTRLLLNASVFQRTFLAFKRFPN